VQSIMGSRRSEMFEEDDDFELDDLSETISEGGAPEEEEGDDE